MSLEKEDNFDKDPEESTTVLFFINRDKELVSAGTWIRWLSKNVCLKVDLMGK